MKLFLLSLPWASHSGQGFLLSVKVTQSCLTFCDPMDYTVHGILQPRILEWIAFPSPRDLPNPGIQPRSPALQADSLPTELFHLLQLLNCVQLFATLWTVTHQALSVGFSRQEYRSGLPFPLPKKFVGMSAMGLNKVSFTMSPNSTIEI